MDIYRNNRIKDSDRKFEVIHQKNLIPTLSDVICNDMSKSLSHTWLFVTISANKLIKCEYVFQSAIYHIQHNIEQRIFKNKVHLDDDGNFDYQDYLKYYGYYEKGTYEDNSHYHLLVRIDKSRVKWFEDILPKFAQKTIKSASVNIQSIDIETVNKVVSYATKDYIANKDGFLISDKSSLSKPRRLVN